SGSRQQTGHGPISQSRRSLANCYGPRGRRHAQAPRNSAGVMASLPVVKTKLVCFDTVVLDLTEELSDPVEGLFGVQLGGGTDIGQAVAYYAGRIERPSKAHLCADHRTLRRRQRRGDVGPPRHHQPPGARLERPRWRNPARSGSIFTAPKIIGAGDT